MYQPESFAAALTLMLIGMIGWGSWGNAYKMTPKRRFELFYIDYVTGTFLIALIGALTMGSWFGAPTFLDNLRSASVESCAYALLAGCVLNFGNILLTAGIALVGMAVAFPIALGLSIVASTFLSYMIAPRGNPVPLFAGVALVFVAVVFSSLAYRARGTDGAKPSRKGLLLCLFSGILFSGFAPLVAKAFSVGSPVSPYGAAVLFTAGALASTFPLMAWFMRRPVEGPPLGPGDFFRSTWREHWVGLVGGFVWGTGTVLTFVAAGFVGMALAGAIGQANSLVAAIWGVFVWREFAGAPARSKLWLTLMFLFYVSGIVSIAFSHEEKTAPARFEVTRETTTTGRPVDLIVLRDNLGGLEAAIAPAEGGELSGFRVKHQNRWNELIYRARDYVETQGWRGKAPFLWPATGRNFAPGVRPDFALNAVGAYDIGGQRYPMPLHGFAREMVWSVIEQSASSGEASATLLLNDSPETHRYYPFGFRVTVQYRLRDGELGLLYTVTASRENTGPMPFSIGNHLILRAPFVPGSDVGAMMMETPSRVELLKTADGLATGASRPRSVSPPVRLTAIDTSTAVSLGGYNGNPLLKLSDPAGLSLTISHEASSVPEEPLVQFNLWGEPGKGYFSPEPWVGLQNSLVRRQGLVSLDAGSSWTWRVVLRPEAN